MRRPSWILALLACLLALGIAGCGGDDESSSPLGGGLSYLPKDSPFAIVLDTDLDGEGYQAVDSILKKFPLPVGSVKELLRGQLAAPGSGVDFEEDVEPILGNPVVLGASDPTGFLLDSGDDEFVASLQATDKDALDSLIEKTKPRETGELGGATKYEDDGTVFAVKDDVVILAGSEELLDQALERAEGDGHLDEPAFDRALEGLPGEAIARVYANVQALLESDPDSADAQKVKWVDALRTLGMTASARDDGVEVQFNLRTDSEGLSEDDLPTAAGDDSPPVIERDGEIGLGLRNPAQVLSFAEAAGQAIDPAGFGDYAKAKQTLDARLGVDIDDDLIAQLTGDVSASVSLDRKFGVRAELKDPAAFEDALEKMAPVLPDLVAGTGTGPVELERPRGGDGLFALAQSDGDAVVFGVRNDVFVMTNERARARELADAEPADVDGAEGALVMSADAQELVNNLIEEMGTGLGLGGLESFGAQLVTAPLEELGGSASLSTDGLRGRISLGID